VARQLLTEESSIREDLISRFVSLGLASYPARTLVALLENPGSSASRLCEITGIPDSKIYQALDDLDRNWNLIEVRKGTPSLHKALGIEQIITNLKEIAESDHTRRLQTLEILKKRLEPVARRVAAGTEELEVAYIVKGHSNIIQKLKNTIENAEKQVIFLTYESELLEPLLPSLSTAKRGGVDVRLALAPTLEKIVAFGSVKSLLCKCNVLLMDNSKLLSISNWRSEKPYALVTDDPAMVTAAREYHDNPKCCC
jgi:sugar-specific transcriptional regulator TrmB